ncbi:MAG: sulfotransferase family protein [Kiritimatiellae bacterium]|nr:sulfotransferase family protein [Kiritimatiellia bacterium]
MITVVSGLPRSGTSLMMQMLKAGGMELLVDEARPADPDNPRGYCEYEKAKRLDRDNSWMAEAEGKAVKLVSQLLYSLPAGHEYRVIFMTRAMEEILASQRDMLARRGAAPGGPADAAMANHFEAHLQKLRRWLKGAASIRVLECDFNRLVREPRAAADEVIRFLGLELDVEAMCAAVDPSLYRHKHTP